MRFHVFLQTRSILVPKEVHWNADTGNGAMFRLSENQKLLGEMDRIESPVVWGSSGFTAIFPKKREVKKGYLHFFGWSPKHTGTYATAQSEFKHFKIATQETSVDYQETSYKRMFFRDLVQKFLLQQKVQVKFATQEKDYNAVRSSGLISEATASSAEGATSHSPSYRPSESSRSSTQASDQPTPGLPQPQPHLRARSGPCRGLGATLNCEGRMHCVIPIDHELS